MTHDSCETFVRASHDCRETFVRVSHDVRANFSLLNISCNGLIYVAYLLFCAGRGNFLAIFVVNVCEGLATGWQHMG